MKRIILAAALVAAGSAAFTSCDKCGNGQFKDGVDTLSYEIGMLQSGGERIAPYLAQAGSDSAYIDEYVKGFTDGYLSGDDKKKVAYYMGLMQGMQNKQQMKQMEMQLFAGDSTRHISAKQFLTGASDAINGRIKLQGKNGDVITQEEAIKHINDFIMSKLRNESQAFYEKKAAEAGVKKLAQGVILKTIKPGVGTTKPAVTDSVTVKYEGTLADGRVFDSSEMREGGLAGFRLTNLIKGWQIAMTEMTEGGQYEITVPYQAGYGEQGNQGIPPYATLCFKVTLVKID